MAGALSRVCEARAADLIAAWRNIILQTYTF